MINDTEHCTENHIPTDFVHKLSEEMQDDDLLIDLAEFFKVFGDSTRIKILYALYKEDMCVCDIADLLGMTLSAISHQLKVLKTFRLIKNKRDGKSVIYSLADTHVAKIISQGLEHIEE